MPRKFLICEDDQSTANAFKRNIQGRGQECTIHYDPDPYVVLINLETMLEKEKPQYVIIDGLNGFWENVAEKTLEYKAIPIICSGDNNIIEDAKEKGYIAFGKNSESDKLFEYVQRVGE